MATKPRTPRYSQGEINDFVQTALKDGYVILKNHFPQDVLQQWREAFQPLLEKHIEKEGHLKNRGANRYYVTLPFDSETMFANPLIYEDEDVLRVVEGLVGKDFQLCQLATDTPLLGSEYQEIHRDTPPLFPELEEETPSYQLAVNFPLCDVDIINGPVEIAKGTHRMNKAAALKLIESGEVKVEPVIMKLGDVMIRDVRGIHRGTPNKTNIPRPMVVLGYSRRWLLRPEVRIEVSKQLVPQLSERAKHMLRFNPIVDLTEKKDGTEVYQSFAY